MQFAMKASMLQFGYSTSRMPLEMKNIISDEKGFVAFCRLQIVVVIITFILWKQESNGSKHLNTLILDCI